MYKISVIFKEECINIISDNNIRGAYDKFPDFLRMAI